MTSAYSNILRAFSKRGGGTNKPARVFRLDRRIWKIVDKEMSGSSPEASYWLSKEILNENILFKDCLLSLKKEEILKYDIWACFMDMWLEEHPFPSSTSWKYNFSDKKRAKLRNEWFEKYAPTPEIAEEIELEIVKALWNEHRWPSTLPYNRREVSSYYESGEIDPSVNESEFGFVYFIRNKDLYKIGITTNILRRMEELKPDEILNMMRCKNYFEVETKIHKKFKKVRIPQSEYFRLSREQIHDVHRLMLDLAITFE